MTLQAHLAAAAATLAAAGIARAEAALDADLLARHVLEWDRATLLARRTDEAPRGFAPAYEALVARRARREPVAYIRGTQEFWGRDFRVGPGVLIPRPETELIIEEALRWASSRPAGAPVRLLDIGTGSGCLAITLALEIPEARVTATDVSADALDVARDNARRLGASIDLRPGAGLAAARLPFDLVVSNPPYVTVAEHTGLQPEVRDYEPATALIGGVDGLDVVREVVDAARTALEPGGGLLVEIGATQAAGAARVMAEAPGLELLRIRPDLQGLPRVVVAQRVASPATSSG